MNDALWALGRGTGIVALALLTLSLVLGIVGRSGRPIAGLGRFGVNELHRTSALVGTSLIAAHVGSLFLDPYAQLRLVDLMVPFLGARRPFWLGLGTLGADVLVVVVAVSLLRDTIGPRVFRLVHWATYLLWPLSLAHTIGEGTDGHSAWLLGLSAGCLLAVAGAVGWRISPAYAERGWSRTPRTLVP